MKIQIEETVYEGTATEIMGRLRDQTFDPTVTSSKIPVIICWPIWRVIGHGAMTRILMKPTKRRKNPEKWKGEAIEDTDRRNGL